MTPGADTFIVLTHEYNHADSAALELASLRFLIHGAAPAALRPLRRNVHRSRFRSSLSVRDARTRFVGSRRP